MADKEYVVIAIPQAQLVNEGLGRLYAEKIGREWPILAPGAQPGDLVGATLYLFEPQLSADDNFAAFGPRDENLDYCIGKTIQCEEGQCVVPDHYTALPREWFKYPPPEEPPSDLPPPGDDALMATAGAGVPNAIGGETNTAADSNETVK